MPCRYSIAIIVLHQSATSPRIFSKRGTVWLTNREHCIASDLRIEGQEVQWSGICCSTYIVTTQVDGKDRVYVRRTISLHKYSSLPTPRKKSPETVSTRYLPIFVIRYMHGLHKIEMVIGSTFLIISQTGSCGK